MDTDRTEGNRANGGGASFFVFFALSRGQLRFSGFTVIFILVLSFSMDSKRLNLIRCFVGRFHPLNGGGF